MDLDLFITRHEPEWQRLDVLASSRRPSGPEADELVALYRQVATHLALVQSRAPDPVLAARLSRLLARARSAAVRTPKVRGWAALRRGVAVDFPTIVYRTWRWSAITAGVNIVLAVAIWLWLRAHPGRIDRVLPSNEVHRLVNHDFRHYYSAAPAQAFAFHVWTNNALVAALALFLGVTLVGTLSVLASNTANLGLVGGVMISSGHSGEFFGLILPHGMLELTAVFVASAIGLRTGWSWVAPGELTRADSLAIAGREAGVCALGLAGVLAVSGAIEAFVTPSGLPTWARIGIGAVAEATFLTYVIVLGRRGASEAAAAARADLAENSAHREGERVVTVLHRYG